MLHIVQVVLSGSVETPQVYCDEGGARAAYVECAKKYWAQSYAGFCERSGLDRDSFLSAQAFVATFDLADRSRIHCWSLAPVDGTVGGAGSLLPGLEALQERRERIERLAEDLEQVSGAVREELTELQEAIAALTGDGTAAAGRPVDEPDRPRTLAADSSAQTPAMVPQPPAELYTTKEWQEYVESIKNMCGGSRSEFHLFTRQDWRQAVYSDQTPFEYWEWVAATIDHYIEKAQQAGYAVVADPDKPGRYRFRTPDGVVADIATDTEGEAWCRAGLHLEGKGGAVGDVP